MNSEDISFEDIVKIESNNLSQSLNNILKDHSNYSINIVNDSHKYSYIDVFGINSKKILTVKYEILGTYDATSGIFNWACDQMISNKEITTLSKQIKKYSKDLKKMIIKNKYNDTNYLEKIYYYLSNTIFFLESVNLIDIIKISIFVTKCKGVIKNNNSSNNKITTLYLVTDIISY